MIEPTTPGTGIYDTTQPDYLVMNNPCSEISMYPLRAGEQQPPYALSLYQWAASRGYCWIGDTCMIGSGGKPVAPEDFLPRRMMGEYLQWMYRALVSDVPEEVAVIRHATCAVDVVARRDGREQVRLANGESLAVDHVILTFGHVGNQEPDSQEPSLASPYPVAQHLDPIPSCARVVVCGMGLVGMDIVAALTLGRGGRFVGEEDRMQYRASGLEPTLHLMSRSGLPYRSKAIGGSEAAGRKAPIVFTREAIERLRKRDPAAIDFRRDVLPLLFGEMSARYYLQSAFSADGACERSRVEENLVAASANGRFAEEIECLARRFGDFDAEAMFFGSSRRYDSSDDYQDAVHRAITDDITERKGGRNGSPLNAAAEVFRVMRDSIRSVVEYGGLSLESYRDFHGDIRTRINRLVAGPPAWQLRQVVALMDAGILRMPYGPAPDIRRTSAHTSRVSSTLLDRPYADDADLVVRGYLKDPSIEWSASDFLARLYRRGRLTPLRYGNVSVGSIDITLDSHPIDRHGSPQSRLWIFGAVTDGVRYFTHYVPSPHRGTRAFEDIGACVEEILA